MSGLLGSLIARNLGGSSSLRARSLSLFEPAPALAALSTSPATRIQSTMRSDEPMTEESNWMLDRAQDFAEEAAIRTARQHAPAARELTPHQQTGIIRQLTEVTSDRNGSLSIEEYAPAARPAIRTADIQSAPVVPPRGRHDAEIQAGSSQPPRSPISALADRAVEENPTPFKQRTPRPSAEENQLAFGRTQSGLLDAATTRHNLSERVETASLAPLAARRETRMDHPVAPLSPAKRRAIQPDFPLPAQNPEPSIHVTIGRIEIRAERESSSPRKNEKAASPVLGLEEYLRRKNTRGKE